MFQLNNLTSSGKKKKRVGRGGSRGGTSGKGHKGQKARSGPAISASFEGGQMPLSRRLPKRGFSNKRFGTYYDVVSLAQLEKHFADGATIDKALLIKKGVLGKHKGKSVPFKVLGTGTLSKKLTVHADALSKSAVKAIQERGGEVHLTGEI